MRLRGISGALLRFCAVASAALKSQLASEGGTGLEPLNHKTHGKALPTLRESSSSQTHGELQLTLWNGGPGVQRSQRT